MGIHDGTIITAAPNEEYESVVMRVPPTYDGSQKVTNYYITDAGKYSVDATIAGLNYKTNELEVTTLNPGNAVYTNDLKETSEIDHGTATGAGLKSCSVSLDGTRVAFGFSNGKAKVYHLETGVWTLKKEYTKSGTFGTQVCLNDAGTRLFVSDPSDSSNTGKVYVYDYSGSAWGSSETHSWTSPNGSTSDRFGGHAAKGISCNSAGTRLLVVNGYTGSKKAYIFDHNGSSWNTAPTKSWSSGSSWWGSYCALNDAGDRAFIGYQNGIDIFHYDGSNWPTSATKNYTGSDSFGVSLTINGAGTRLLTSSYNYSSGAGQTTLYDYVGGSWNTSATQTINGSYGGNSYYGSGINMSRDGKRYLVSAHNAATYFSGSGFVNMMEDTTGSGSFTLKQIFKPDQANENMGSYSFEEGLCLDQKGYTAVIVSAGQEISRIYSSYPIPTLDFDNYNKLSMTNTPTNTSSKLFLGSNVYDIGTLTSDLTIETPGLYKGLVFDTSSNVAYFNKTTVGAIASTQAGYGADTIIYGTVQSGASHGTSQGGFGNNTILNADGTRLLVTDPINYPSGHGRAYIYHLENGSWDLKQTWDNPDNSGQRFSDGVCMNEDGTRLFLMQPSSNKVYTYEYASGAWPTANAGTHTISPGSTMNHEASTLACNKAGDVLVIGYGNSNKVKIYRRTSATSWSIDSGGDLTYNRGVAINGDGTRAFMAYSDGKVYMVEWNGSTWSSATEIISSGYTNWWATTMMSDSAGETLVMRSGGSTSLESGIYERASNGTWSRAQGIEGKVSIYGSSMPCISYDGTMVLTGNFRYDSNKGLAQLWQKSGGSWSLTKEYLNPDASPSNGDYWGTGCGIARTTKHKIAIGMQGDDTAGTDYGSVHIYTNAIPDFISFDTYNKLSLSGITNPTSKLHALPTGAESTTTYDIGSATNIYIESVGTYTAEMKGASAFALDSNVVGAISTPTYPFNPLAYSFPITLNGEPAYIISSESKDNYIVELETGGPLTSVDFDSDGNLITGSSGYTRTPIVPDYANSPFKFNGTQDYSIYLKWKYDFVSAHGKWYFKFGETWIACWPGNGYSDTGNREIRWGPTGPNSSTYTQIGSFTDNQFIHMVQTYEASSGTYKLYYKINDSASIGVSTKTETVVTSNTGKTFAMTIGRDMGGSSGRGTHYTKDIAIFNSVLTQTEAESYINNGISISPTPPSLTFDGFNKYTFTGADTGSTYKLKYESNTYDLGTISNVYIANPGTYSAEIKGATNFGLSSNVVSGTITPYKTILKTQDILGTVANEQFGKTDYEGTGSLSFSKDGTRLVVGSWMYNSQQGRFYIYTLSGGQYVLDSGMPIDGTSGSHLGYAVNLNDDGTKVGIGTNGSQGWAKVYERSSSGSWSLRGSTFGSGAYWTRGLVLDASGDRALGAAHGDGTLKLFDWSGSAYTETTTFSGSGTIFGCGFDMTRDGLTVIGINRDTNAIVKVWKYASGSWSQLGSDINVGDMTDAIHMARGTGTRFVVGAHFNNSSTGIVKVYEYSGSSWSKIKQWTGYTSGVSLGIDHSISDDGTIIIAGSNADDTGSSGSNAGMISIFTETNGIWEEKRFFGDTDNDQLGYGVTMSYDGGFYAACAPDNDEAASNAGKVRIYQNKNVLDFDGYNKLTFSGLESGSTSNVTFNGNTYSIGTASNVYIENTGTYEAESKGTTTFALTKNVVGAGQISIPPVYPSVSVAPTVVTPINFTSGSWSGQHYFVYRGDVVQNGITHYHWNLEFQSGNTPVNYSVLYDYVNRIWKDGDGSTPFYMSPSTPLVGTNLSVTNPVNVHGFDTNQTSEYFGFPNPYYQAPNYTPSLTFDGYKLVVKNITPTSTTLKYFSNTYEIGSATNIYVKDTGAYTAEIGNATDFALTSNTVSGTIKTIEPGFASRYQGSMALTYDGKLYAWGMNDDGEAGVGTSSDITVPTLCTGITQGTVAKLLSSSDLTDNSRGEVSAIKTTDGKIYMAGKGDNNCIPGKTSDQTSFTDVTSYFGDQSLTANTVTMMSFTDASGAALTETGNVWTWGTHDSTYKRLGQASASSSSTPKQINFSSATDNITKVTCGHYHTVALDSSGDVWFWGKNGINSTSWPSSITDEPQKVVDGKNIIGLSQSYGTMYAWDATGKMWNAGNNYEGQIGDGTTTANSSGKTLTEVTYFSSKGITINKVYGGGYFVFADTSDGYYCWGNGGHGVFGNGSTGNITSGPAKWTNVSNIKKFMASTQHTTAITEDGKYYAWGRDYHGGRGDSDSSSDITYPKYIDTLPNILAPSFEFDGYDKVFVNESQHHCIRILFKL